MKSRTKRNPVTDEEFAYEMMKRRHKRDERVNPTPYHPRSKYDPHQGKQEIARRVRNG